MATGALILLAFTASAAPAGATGGHGPRAERSSAREQASQPVSPAAGGIDAGVNHTCALLAGGQVRCWGYGAEGELGYPQTSTVGSSEAPGSVGPVDLGPGRTATAISAGDYHTCALLDDGTVRCWGFGADGRLGYGNTDNVGDDETPGSVGPVDLGPGRTARGISAGGGHTCAVLDDGSVRCWGYGFSGQLGYGSQSNVGDTPATTPTSAGPVDVGLGRWATAISAGTRHTCAVLDDGTVRCWGNGGSGRLGSGSTDNIGDDETPGSLAPVDLGPGHTARAISAGDAHTCALLDDGTLRCWGFGFSGQLGYGSQSNIGDTLANTPGNAGPVDLGPGRSATAISAGASHTCAVLDDGTVRCWGYGADGRLGYGATNTIGDHQTPGAAGPVRLGAGRSAVAVTAGARHSCARLDDGTVRCWGYGGNGRLGYCNQDNVGDDETPDAAGPVSLRPGDGGAGCAPAPKPVGPSPGMSQRPPPARPAVSSDAARARGLRRCLARVARQANRAPGRSRRGRGRSRPVSRRGRAHRARAGRRRCLRRYARTPGRVSGLRARALSRTRIELSFVAPGTDGSRPPPARSYLIKQSRRPIRDGRQFARAPALCNGACRFNISRIGARITLTITNLRPRATYYYVVVARDNVTARLGPRSRAVRQRTR